MLQQERFNRIVALVNEHHFCSVHQLARRTGASPATIRRDLQYLSAQEQIRLTRGGAMRTQENSVQEPAYDIKTALNLDEKVRIGREAVKLITPGETLLIDTGTTVLQMAVAMAETQRDWQGVNVAINDLRAAYELCRIPDLTLHMLGGTIRRGYYTTLGRWTQSALEGLHADKCFLSCDAVDLQNGLSITNAEEVAIKQMMLHASREIILLCDHSKFGLRAFMQVCPVESIHHIITGQELDPAVAKRFRDAGIEMTLV